jgi:hypothetical protein
VVLEKWRDKGKGRQDRNKVYCNKEERADRAFNIGERGETKGRIFRKKVFYIRFGEINPS